MWKSVWITLAQDRDNWRGPSSVKYGEFLSWTVSFSRGLCFMGLVDWSGRYVGWLIGRVFMWVGWLVGSLCGLVDWSVALVGSLCGLVDWSVALVGSLCGLVGLVDLIWFVDRLAGWLLGCLVAVCWLVRMFITIRIRSRLLSKFWGKLLQSLIILILSSNHFNILQFTIKSWKWFVPLRLTFFLLKFKIFCIWRIAAWSLYRLHTT